MNSKTYIRYHIPIYYIPRYESVCLCNKGNKIFDSVGSVQLVNSLKEVSKSFTNGCNGYSVIKGLVSTNLICHEMLTQL